MDLCTLQILVAFSHCGNENEPVLNSNSFLHINLGRREDNGVKNLTSLLEL